MVLLWLIQDRYHSDEMDWPILLRHNMERNAIRVVRRDFVERHASKDGLGFFVYRDSAGTFQYFDMMDTAYEYFRPVHGDAPFCV